MKNALLSTVEKAGMRGSPFNAMVEHGLPCLRRYRPSGTFPLVHILSSVALQPLILEPRQIDLGAELGTGTSRFWYSVWLLQENTLHFKKEDKTNKRMPG